MTWKVLLRREVGWDNWYLPRCGNDRCCDSGRYYFAWVQAGDTEANPSVEAYCSLKCFVEAGP